MSMRIKRAMMTMRNVIVDTVLAAWSTFYKSNDMIVVEPDLVRADINFGSSGDRGHRARIAYASGKRYFEIELIAFSDFQQAFAGLATTSQDYDVFDVDTTTNHFLYYVYSPPGGTYFHGLNDGGANELSMPANQNIRICVAVDFDLGLIWMKEASQLYVKCTDPGNSTVGWSGLNEFTLPSFTFTPGTALYPIYANASVGNTQDARFILSNFSVDSNLQSNVPPGFSHWFEGITDAEMTAVVDPPFWDSYAFTNDKPYSSGPTTASFEINLGPHGIVDISDGSYGLGAQGFWYDPFTLSISDSYEARYFPVKTSGETAVVEAGYTSDFGWGPPRNLTIALTNSEAPVLSTSYNVGIEVRNTTSKAIFASGFIEVNLIANGDVPALAYEWSSLNSGSGITITNGGLTVASSVNEHVSVVDYPLTGKKYWELAVDNISGYSAPFVGLIGSKATPPSTFESGMYGVGDVGIRLDVRDAFIYLNSGLVGSFTDMPEDDTAKFALNADTNEVWIGSVGLNTWYGGGDPAIGLAPTGVLTADSYRIFAQPLGTSGDSTVTLHREIGELANIPPSGFTPLIEPADLVGTGDEFEHIPTSYFQSSVYSGQVAASATNMRDANGDGDPTTATATDASGLQFIGVDLGEPKQVSKIRIGGGEVLGFGGIFPTYASGAAFTLQYSTDNVTWVSVRNTITEGLTNSPTANRDVDLFFVPVVARYWRISRVGDIAIATFRVFGYDVTLTRAVGITYSQSSTYTSNLIATEARLNEEPPNSTTGAATNSSSNEFIQADLGVARHVRVIVVGTSSVLGDWGAVSSYLINAPIESSDDEVTWTPRATIPAYVTDVAPDLWAIEVDATARYWRIADNSTGYVATTAFRLYYQND